MRTFYDPEFGAIAAAEDDDGNILATSASRVKNGVYIALDEAAVFEATGDLPPLPPGMWDACSDNEEQP